jgi:hypothetical protein
MKLFLMHAKCVVVINSDGHTYSSFIEIYIPLHAVNVPDHVLSAVHLIMTTLPFVKLNRGLHLKVQAEP